MRDRIGFLLLFSGCVIIFFTGFYLALSWTGQEWLVQVFAQYFGLEESAREYIRWLVNSFAYFLNIAGIIILIGAIIWVGGPRRPHPMADFILAVAKIVIAFGASIMTIPIAFQTLGIMVASIFTIGGHPISGFYSIQASLVSQFIGLIVIGLGSYLITKQ